MKLSFVIILSSSYDNFMKKNINTQILFCYHILNYQLIFALKTTKFDYGDMYLGVYFHRLHSFEIIKVS